MHATGRTLVTTLGLGAAGLLVFALAWMVVSPPTTAPRDNPRAQVPGTTTSFDHAAVIQGPFPDGPAVTRQCLTCHEDAARDFMKTAHWTWLGEETTLPGRDKSVRMGKANLLNNFCISVEGNWKGCTGCHAGYGWDSADFDFADEEKVDCLVCHEQTGNYSKPAGLAGMPAPGTDLEASARSVGRPTRRNCGTCHFSGGGGNAVKHGDLDRNMILPSERIDVHMSREKLECVDCHKTEAHDIPGRSMSVSAREDKRVRCVDCHSQAPHESERLNGHTAAVSCQACHIPHFAVGTPTKMDWRWSEAGNDDIPDDPHTYLKIKGRFEYARKVEPVYRWYNGSSDRYLKGDPVEPGQVVELNRPLGDARDPQARIWPFKVHTGNQPYDPVNRYLLVPHTYGEGGYWTEFDWPKAFEGNQEVTGLAYSGQHDFIDTVMYWPLSHMVQRKAGALQCADCHSPEGRMDWEALGYPGDPYLRGGRSREGLLREGGTR